MKTVIVHHFQHYDFINDVSKSPPSKRTAKDITALGCKIIPGTAEKVDAHQLDDEGRYYPPGTEPMGK